MPQGDEAQLGLKQSQKEGEEEVMEIQDFNFYLKPENAYVIIIKKWQVFTLFAAVIYLYHLYFTIMGVDKYADITRTYKCTADQPGSMSETEKDEQSAIFDSAIMLCTIFHMIEWIRWLSYLTMALVSVNLVKFYYMLSFNIVFGFFTCIYALMTAFRTDGSDCANAGQEARGAYLQWQGLVLLLHIPFSMAHYFFFKMRGVEWCHEVFIAEDEEDED